MSKRGPIAEDCKTMEVTMQPLSSYLLTTTTKNQVRHYRARGRLIRNGQCVAALRALNAAEGYLTGRFPTLQAAAICCGSCVAYVRAAITILKADDAKLVRRVLRGDEPLLRASAAVTNAVILAETFHKASVAERELFGRWAGPAEVFDSVVTPAL
jgi:hypothetical protein